jgi:hypothetical protein
MTSAKIDLRLDDASDAAVKLVWKDNAGTPVDVTLFNWIMSLYKYGESPFDTLTSDDGEINRQPNGLLIINFVGADVDDYPSEFMYDLMFVNITTSKAGFLARGIIRLNLTASRPGD